MNTTDTNALVEMALEEGYGLWVEMDSGYVELFGDELRDEWDAVAPGESFQILSILVDKETPQDN